jgi:MFS family permease
MVRDADSRNRNGNLYYGWIVVGALALTITSSYGILSYAFTVFIKPMSAELGWTIGQLTSAYSLAGLVNVVFGLILGRLLDQHGSRVIMSIGTLSAALLLVAWSSVTRIELFYAIIFMLSGVSITVFYPPAFWAVSSWFSRKRRRALTLMTFTGGFASIIFTPLTQALIAAFGWRATLVIYACLMLFINLPLLAILLRRRPADLGLRVDGDAIPSDAIPEVHITQKTTDVTVGMAVRNDGFWWLTAALTLNSIVGAFMVIHFVPFLIERSYSAAFAAGVYGLIGVASLPGRLIFTPLGDRIPAGWITVLIFLAQTLAFLVLATGQGNWAIMLFLILFAAGYGAISPSNAALIAEIFGVRHYGKVSSLIGMVSDATTALVLTILAMLRDRWGSYTGLVWLLVLLSTLSVICMITAWKRCEILFISHLDTVS